jgi:hypothetical protein
VTLEKPTQSIRKGLLAEVGERRRGKGEMDGILPFPLPFNLSPKSWKRNFCKMSKGLRF